MTLMPPPLRIAICGPGRVGRALGAGWVAEGYLLHGYYGHSLQGASKAAAVVGGGARVLDPNAVAALRGTLDVLIFAVPDDRLVGAIEAWAPRLADLVPATDASESTGESTDESTDVSDTGPNRGLWVIHTSGAHGLDVFSPMRNSGRDVRFASLHPVCPVPAGSGPDVFRGRPAVVELDRLGDDPGSNPSAESVAHPDRLILERLARAVRLQPLIMRGGNRLLYHAACVLSANGLTALFGAVTDLFARALPGEDSAPLAASLMRAALDACVDQGAAAALSGPVARGDSGLVRSQRQALDTLATEGEWGNWPADVYSSLMRGAADLATSSGSLEGAAAASMREALGRHG